MINLDRPRVFLSQHISDSGLGSGPSASASPIKVIAISDNKQAIEMLESGAIVIAARRGAEDHSSPGLETPDPADPAAEGLASRANRIRGAFADRDVVFATVEPNLVIKALAVALLKGSIPTDGQGTTPAAVKLQDFIAIADAFHADLVNGWPKGNSITEQAFKIVNQYCSQHSKVEELPDLHAFLVEVLKGPINAEHLKLLDKENERESLASTFEHITIPGIHFRIAAVRETNTAGFHPAKYAEMSGADLVLVFRENQFGPGVHQISGFCSSDLAARIDSAKGLAKLPAIFNLDESVPFSDFGGSFNRFGGPPRKGNPEELWSLTTRLAELAAKSL